jgi:hypothetical protein
MQFGVESDVFKRKRLLVRRPDDFTIGCAKASRGSGAIPSFADTIFELRRYCPGDKNDRRRVLSGFGRWDDTPKEVVIELAQDSSEYRAHGDKQEVRQREIKHSIVAMLPNEPSGKTAEDIAEEWPSGSPPTKATLLAELRAGSDQGDWHREGEGKKGSPYTFWVRPPG